jgi:hypothetical protein
MDKFFNAIKFEKRKNEMKRWNSNFPYLGSQLRDMKKW